MGYYYDDETGLYYLNSRYYNPEWGRFISADTPAVTTLSPDSANYNKNLFAYCDNNPVMRRDDGGQFWQIIIGGLIGGAIGAFSAIASGGNWKDALVGGIFGAASGVLAASGVGMLGQIAGGAAFSMASNAGQQINKIVDGTQDEFNYGSMIFDGVVGGVCGRLGGTGASYGNVAGINAAEKQFIKRGLTKAAKTYFVSQAHKQGGVYVYDALSKSLKILAAGSSFLAMKERVLSCNA